jgi:hypothetical protein
MDLFEGNFATKFETGGVWGDSEYMTFVRNYHDLRHDWLCNGCDPLAIAGFTPQQTSDSSCFQMGPTAFNTTYLGNVCGRTGQTISYEGTSGGAHQMFFFRSAPQVVVNEALRGYSLIYPTGNTVWGVVPQGDTIKRSYYLSQKPSWWEDRSAPGYCRPWPAVGPDVAGYVVDIPAKDRFEGQTYSGTLCGGTAPPASPQNLRIIQ